MKKLICLLISTLMMFSAITVSADQDTSWSHITLAENAQLPDSDGENYYPASVRRGQSLLDIPSVLNRLMTEGWMQNDDDDSAEVTYCSLGGEQPWEYKHASLNLEDDEFWYYNPMITGERGAEYTAPAMNILPSESIAVTKAILEGVIDSQWLTTQDPAQLAAMRWNNATDRWMSDSEYEKEYESKTMHSFRFAHLSSDGIPIQGEVVMAHIGVDGLSGLTLQWHDWSYSDHDISPMPLNEAITMANSTRESDTVLYYAGLIYSNWISENDDYNLCWYLLTSNGNYVVDCVLKKHMCDSYEY